MALIVERDGTIVEAEALGVVRSPVSKYLAPEFHLVRLGAEFDKAGRQRAVAYANAQVGVAFGYLALSRPIVRLLLQHGVTQSNSTQLLGSVLTYFSIGLFSFCVFQLLLRAFYGMQNTRTPALVNVMGTAVNIVAMVYGNMGNDCGTGVAFTRNCSTGERVVEHWTRCATVTDPAAVATAPKPRGAQR